MPPLTTSGSQPGFLNELASAAFKRIGVEAEVTSVYAERPLINANSGLDDGDVYRVAGLETEFVNLGRVPEKVLDSEFLAYARNPGVRVATWADLKTYSVAYAAGWKIFERNIHQAQEVTVTPTILELFPLLEKNRVDLILLDRWQGQRIAKEKGYQAKSQ